MDVIRRFVWGTMALGVLAILGGTSALAFDGDPQDAVRPAEQNLPGVTPASVPTPDLSAALRWMAPHTIPLAVR